MKVAFYASLIYVLLLSVGCSRNSLVKRFKARGVAPGTTAMLKFIGSDDDFGTEVSVTTDDTDIIKEVWMSIYSAAPAEPCGGFDFGKIEFYTSKKVEWPAATLLVNPTGDSFLDTEFSYQYDNESDKMLGLMRCHGLHELRVRHLEKEYLCRKGGP